MFGSFGTSYLRQDMAQGHEKDVSEDGKGLGGQPRRIWGEHRSPDAILAGSAAAKLKSLVQRCIS